MKKNTPEQLAEYIMAFYNEYDLRVSGKINNQTAYQLIETIEQKYKTDTIRLSDGTRLWNLLRIFLYSYFQKQQQSTQKKLSKRSIGPVLSVFKESFLPLKLPSHIKVCGFSSGESRKLYNNTYYDIYLDPLYEILGDTFAVFEWPETTGQRRKYDHPVFSKNHVLMHIPLWKKTFWELFANTLTGKKNFTLESEDIFKQIVVYISTTASIDKDQMTKDINDFITVFVAIKHYLCTILKKIKPHAVLIRCGYGRFPMALSQACREQQIPAIELQHGLITTYLPAYRRTTPTTNKDCTPEYLLTHGDIYTRIVRNGNLFDKEKVFSIGYPYLEKKLDEKKDNRTFKKLYSRYAQNVLFTSQWNIALETQQFILSVADLLEQQDLDIGILFKPHPYDRIDYSAIQKSNRINLIDKYEDTFTLFPFADIHATVYSTSGLEAMAFSVPNLFVDIHKLINFNSTYIVSSPEQFVASIHTILSDYTTATKETKAIADLFFTPSSKKNLTEFFNTLHLF